MARNFILYLVKNYLALFSRLVILHAMTQTYLCFNATGNFGVFYAGKTINSLRIDECHTAHRQQTIHPEFPHSRCTFEMFFPYYLDTEAGAKEHQILINTLHKIEGHFAKFADLGIVLVKNKNRADVNEKRISNDAALAVLNYIKFNLEEFIKHVFTGQASQGLRYRKALLLTKKLIKKYS